MDLSDCEIALGGYVIKYSKCDEHFFRSFHLDGSGERVYAKHGKVSVHRMIMGLSIGDKRCVDHINHDTLDNRRANLRVCTSSNNSMNRVKFCGASQYKGVYWHKRDQCWRASIKHLGTNRRLGTFSTEVDAAMAYDVAARKYHGEFAYLNFKNETTLAANGILQGSAASF